jgi:hypothetical protein
LALSIFPPDLRTLLESHVLEELFTLPSRG